MSILGFILPCPHWVYKSVGLVGYLGVQIDLTRYQPEKLFSSYPHLFLTWRLTLVDSIHSLFVDNLSATQLTPAPLEASQRLRINALENLVSEKG